MYVTGCWSYNPEASKTKTLIDYTTFIVAHDAIKCKLEEELANNTQKLQNRRKIVS